MSQFPYLLLAQSSQAASYPSQELGEFLKIILAMGVVVLGVWVFFCVLRPGRLLLRGHPGLAGGNGKASAEGLLEIRPVRANRLNVVYLALPFAAYLLAQLVISSGIAMAAGLTEKGQSLPPELALPAVILSQVLWLVVGLLVARETFLFGLAQGLGLSGRHWIFDSLRAVVGYLAAMPLIFLALEFTVRLMPPELQHQHELLKLLPSSSRLVKAMVVVSAALMAPLCEEVFFRGLMQSLLRRYLPAWPAVIVASLTFALSHVMGEAPPWQDVPALFVLALALGYNYERSGRLLAPILIHAIFNLVMIIQALSR